GYNSETVQCSSCEKGYIEGFDSCQRCPAKALALVLLCFALVFTVVGTLTERLNKKTLSYASICFGHFQVMAQVRLVYPWYHGGSSFAWLFSASEVTRFECISWLPLSCVWDELTSGFLLRFVFFAWLPFILAIPMLYSRMSGYFTALKMATAPIEAPADIPGDEKDVVRFSANPLIVPALPTEHGVNPMARLESMALNPMARLNSYQDFDIYSYTSGVKPESDLNRRSSGVELADVIAERNAELPDLRLPSDGDGQPVTLDESHMSVALSIPINLKSPTLAEVRPPLHYDTSEPLAFLAVTLFCMVMMHPTISSSMFQIFQCDEIYHDNTTVQYFLSVDISFECFTSKWYFCAAVACFVIIVYVFGAPYFLYLTISRCYQMKEFTVNGRIQYVNWWEVEVKEDGYYTLLNQERLLIHPIYIDLNGPFVPTNIRSELDNCSWGRILWPMTNSYKRSLIFWEPYEILRKCFQTSAVMVAQLIVGEGIDIVFNIIIAVVAITIQAYIQPFKLNEDNFLATTQYAAYGLGIVHSRI
ncbi:hypothetical protein CYMTET_42268, partial [Cymbomonas tetramitiformis]